MRIAGISDPARTQREAALKLLEEAGWLSPDQRPLHCQGLLGFQWCSAQDLEDPKALAQRIQNWLEENSKS